MEKSKRRREKLTGGRVREDGGERGGGVLEKGVGRGSGQVTHAGERRGCLLSVCLWRDGVCLVYWFVLPRVVLPVPPVSPRRTWSRYS